MVLWTSDIGLGLGLELVEVRHQVIQQLPPGLSPAAESDSYR